MTGELFPATVTTSEALAWAIRRAAEHVDTCERWLTNGLRIGITQTDVDRARAIHAALTTLHDTCTQETHP